MEKGKKMFSIFVELIVKNKNEDACRLFFDKLSGDILYFITTQLRWEKDEARELLNDAYLIIEKKIEDGEINQINKTYVIEVCKRLGANNYRKLIKNKERFMEFYKTEQRKLIQETKDSIGIELKQSPETEKNKWEDALRAFSMLDEKCRDLIQKKHIEGLNHSEIAKQSAFFSSEDSSKTILNRCMKKWKTFITRIRNL